VIVIVDGCGLAAVMVATVRNAIPYSCRRTWYCAAFAAVVQVTETCAASMAVAVALTGAATTVIVIGALSTDPQPFDTRTQYWLVAVIAGVV
jgi:hypothetical protein